MGHCPSRKNGPTNTGIRDLVVSKLVSLKNAMNINALKIEPIKSVEITQQTLNALPSMEDMLNIFNPIDDNHHHYEQQETTGHLRQRLEQCDNGYPRIPRHQYGVNQSMNNRNVPMVQIQNQSLPPQTINNFVINPLSNTLPIFEPITIPQNIAAPNNNIAAPTIIILNVNNVGYGGNHNANNHVSDQRHNPLVGYILNGNNIMPLNL